jgi:glycosyltransferase involved in cell wall biosynthesis
VRVCLVLVGGASDGPVRGTGEIIRQCARAVREAGGDVVTALFPASNMLRAVEEFSSEVIPMAPSNERRGMARNSIAVAEIARRLRPDVVHFHVPNYRWGLDQLISSNVFRARVVRTEHNPLMGTPQRHVRALLRIADAAVDHFSYCSIGNQHKWEAGLPWRAGKGRVLLNFVDSERLKAERTTALQLPSSGATHRAVFMSAFWEIDDTEGRRPLGPVLRAMSRLTTDWELLVVGEGDHGRAARLVTDLGLSGRVHFLGPVVDAWRVTADADLMVNASHFEGLSISFLEAWSLGVPVLSTPVDGIEDVVGSESLSAVTAPIGDLDGFARRWDESALGDGPLVRATTIATQRVRDELTRERWAAQLLELYAS